MERTASLAPPREAGTLTAGRGLDYLVAENVMGWSNLSRGDSGVDAFGWHPNFARELPRDGCVPVPHYSTSILAVHDVLHQLRRRFVLFIAIESEVGGNSGWYVQAGDPSDGDAPWEYATKLPHAICLAALRAVEIASSPEAPHDR
jgi:hypothetical protein